MYTRVLTYYAICKRYRHLNRFSSTVVSEESILNPTREELMDYLDYGSKTRCPDCGEEGVLIINMEFGNLIMDMQESPRVGKISVRAKKINGSLDSCEFGADNENFSLYDYLNALKIFDIRLNELKIKNDSNEQSGLEILQNDSFGNIMFRAQLNDAPPYISLFDSITIGFSYDEIDKIIRGLRKEIKVQLKNRNLPF